MPTITINYGDLIKLIGKEIPLDELEEIILLLKGEVEEVEGKEITIEITADRIDLLSTEGWARAIKGFLEIETGIPEYPILPATTHLKVDSSVLKVRPYIIAAIVRGVNLSEDALIQSLQLQEKLHMTWCRNRKKASIGIYDLDKIKPPITYLALPPEKIRFVPLDTKEEMNGREILEKHPKGIEFAHLLQGAPEYPLLIDSEGTVLSMPPIINSEDTRVTEDTKNLFIDVTGLSEDVINYALNTIVANLAERRGKIELIEVKYPSYSFLSPKFDNNEIDASVTYISKVVGKVLTRDEVINYLRRARLDAKPIDADKIKVIIPPWRADFLHPVDIAEDVAIAFGYNNLTPELPNLFTIGKIHETERVTELIRDIMIGNGFQEIRNYIFTNKDILFRKVLREEKNVVEVANPVTSLYTVLRDSLFPGILKFLSNNIHAPYPQKIFEIGDVVIVDEKAETKTIQYRNLSAAVTDYEISFEDIHAPLHQLMIQIGKKYTLKRYNYPYFISGRSAKIICDNSEVGIVGEVNPEVLVNFNLENPVVLFELNISKILNLKPF